MQVPTSTVSAATSGPVATKWQPTVAPSATPKQDAPPAPTTDVDRAFFAFRRGVELVAYTGASVDTMRASLVQLLTDLDIAQVRAARAAQSAAREPHRSVQPADGAKPEQRAARTHQRFLTPEQLVERWEGSVVLGTLANWRSRTRQGKPEGPAFQKFGSNVRYALVDVEEYERTHNLGPARNSAPGWAARAH